MQLVKDISVNDILEDGVGEWVGFFVLRFFLIFA